MTVDVAEVVLHNCTKLDRHLVNKENFEVECHFDFVCDSINMYVVKYNILIMVSYLYIYTRSELASLALSFYVHETSLTWKDTKNFNNANLCTPKR